ncbi:MAG: rhodanese-like domain-containing protein [Elusimicrobia bacterium]|nr:rhodanese-like domain-containing protein [Elusimicrobiota bacterium]
MTQTLEVKSLPISAVDYFSAKLAYEMTPWTLKGLVVDKNTTACGLKADNLLLLDVRSAEAYAENHIPGAINIPLTELVAKLGTLPKDKTIMTYCSNLTCALAPKAALVLAEKGFKVMELFGGIATWTEYGFPVVKKA